MSEMVGSIGTGRVEDQPAAAMSAGESSDIRKVAVASAIGNMIEYYDFTLYATATALVFNKVFFPSTDPLVGSLLAFATFFVGIGGEYGGGMVMTVEHAPADRRGFFSSLVHVGVPGGFLIPIALLGILSTSMSESDFLAWGWRIPFLFSIVLVAIGVFIRFRISETPAFKRVLDEEGAASVPVVEAVRNHAGNILFGIGAKVAESGLFNVYAVFAITYCKTKLGLPSQTILNGVLVGCAMECVTLPVFGALSDRIGRRAVYVSGLLFQVGLALVFFQMLNTGHTGMIWLAIALGLALGHGSVYGAQGAYFSELFPARIRYSGLSLVQQLGPILGGGLSPLVATALLAEYGSPASVACYMAAMALLSAACAFGLRPLRAGA